MHKNVILIAETGSDVTPELAAQHGIFLVPMHVSMADQTLDDGSFPPEDVCAYYDKTGKVPQTSASSPEDFNIVLDKVHAQFPDHQILHLAYSAITTCSYQNGLLACEDRDYVTNVDTKQVSVGQASVALATARWLEAHPDATAEEAAQAARQIADRTHMCFIPKNLDYLRAGGRVSNVVALTGNLLGLHPCIDIIDGKLMAKKKYRGTMEKVIPKLVQEYIQQYDLDPAHLDLIWSPYLSDELKAIAEKALTDCGIQSFTWMKTGCVITCHGGPSAFGIVGVRKR